MRFLDTRWGTVAALALYCACSIAFFGFPALTDPQGSVVGSFGSDQGFFMWSLVHWKQVVTEGAGLRATFLQRGNAVISFYAETYERGTFTLDDVDPVITAVAGRFAAL